MRQTLKVGAFAVIIMLIGSSAMALDKIPYDPKFAPEVPPKAESLWGKFRTKIKKFCFSDGMCNQKAGEICFNLNCVPQCTDSDGPPTENTDLGGKFVPGKITYYKTSTPSSTDYVFKTDFDSCWNSEVVLENFCLLDKKSGKLAPSSYFGTCSKGTTICQEKEEWGTKVAYCGAPPLPPQPFADYCQKKEEYGFLNDFIPCKTVATCDSATGIITSSSGVTCPAQSECHPQSGKCVSLAWINTPLDDLDACTKDNFDWSKGKANHVAIEINPTGGTCEKLKLPDSDGDGYPDSHDNCPLIPNADQIDSEQDGIGDACACNDHHEMVPFGIMKGFPVTKGFINIENVTALYSDGDSLYAGTEMNGLWQFKSDDIGWISVSQGLPKYPEAPDEFNSIFSLQRHGAYLYLSTADYGIYRTQDPGKGWKLFSNKPIGMSYLVSLMSYGGYLYGASAGDMLDAEKMGLYRLVDEDGTWLNITHFANKPSGVYDVMMHNGSLYASTQAGVFRLEKEKIGWQNAGNGLPLCAGGGKYYYNNIGAWTFAELNGKFYAGCPATGVGVYAFSDVNQNWNALDLTGLPNLVNINRIYGYGNNLYVAISGQDPMNLGGGVYRWNSAGKQWKLLSDNGDYPLFDGSKSSVQGNFCNELTTFKGSLVGACGIAGLYRFACGMPNQIPSSSKSRPDHGRVP